MPILPTYPNVLKVLYIRHLMGRGIDRRLALHLGCLRLALNPNTSPATIN